MEIQDIKCKTKAQARARAKEIARQCAQEDDFYELYEFVAVNEDILGGFPAVVEFMTSVVPLRHTIPL